MSEDGPAPECALAFEEVTQTFEQGGQKIEVLRSVSLKLELGEIMALTGPSGSGKSTLLHIAGLLERPISGEVVLFGVPSGQKPDGERTLLRREKLGFVYQFHHLLPEFSALENVALPQRIAGVPRRAAEERARVLLAELGLAERAGHRPGKLSGGEQQRVALARALANEPKLLLADEPTGNLDQETAGAVFDQLVKLVRETGIAALIATHNTGLADRMDRWVTLEAGRLVEH